MSLRDAIRDYFNRHPRAKKALGVASAIATNFAMIASGSAALAVAAGTIVKAKEDHDRVNANQLMTFFKDAIQDPVVRDSIKEAVKEGGVEVASHVSVAMNQLGTSFPETGQFVDTMKSELTVIMQQMGIIRELVSYYEIPDSRERVTNVWRLPVYIDDVLVIDESWQAAIDNAIEHIRNGENVAILGAPGAGKTTAMYAIWKQLDIDTDTALVWDTKDISRVHEKGGVVLFNDDLPETRELAKAIVERDVHGLITTAREQDWSRLPVALRGLFTPINLPKIPDDVMTKIARNHLDSQNIEYGKNVLPILVASAQGSPIYIRYMAEEIGTEIKIGTIKKLTKARVKTAPKGMTDYVAGILARILFDLERTIYRPKDGALPVIKTLLCLADMPNYETHEVHLNQIFFALKQPSDGPGPFNAIKQYLSRDPRFFSLKFMHDTLADVLRAKVDHPIVGDIRMLAQEMGVSGRREVERRALQDGWMHVKAEYEVDKAGGLDPLLAYSYFAARAFGTEYVDQLGVDLANQHIENPLSQGLFAITGPIMEIPKQVDGKKRVLPPYPEVPSAPLKHPEMPSESKEFGSKDIEDLIKKYQGFLGEEEAAIVKKNLKQLENLPNLEELSQGNLGKFITDRISAALGKSAADIEATSKTRFQRLEEILGQDSVSPRKLSKYLRKAAIRAKTKADAGKLTDKRAKRELLVKAARKLVRLDSMMYIDMIDEIAEALAAVGNEKEAAQEITNITKEIAVSMLDPKTRKEITNVYDEGARRSEKMGDYDGMRAYFVGKWELFGRNPEDLSFVLKQMGKLMKIGRTDFAMQNVADYLSMFDESEIEARIGITHQIFKSLSKARISDRREFEKVVSTANQYLIDLVTWINRCGEEGSEELLENNPAVANLSVTVAATTASLVDSYVKQSGDAVAAKAVYPLLHDALLPLTTTAINIMDCAGDRKSKKKLVKNIQKLKGESTSKNKMLEDAQRLLK